MKSSPELKIWHDEYFRYVNYLGAAMLYLKENFLLRKPLRPEHLKDRILGHWGTVPGLNFIYLHLNHLIVTKKAEMLLVVGPGHGAPAILANLFAEKTLQEFYPDYSLDEIGTGHLLKNFSWPGGFPSHLYPGVPGSILEGGELGYSLSTAFGAAFDNPNLVVACVVGDGEAETGPLAAAWQSNKFLNPATSGAVLPILHVNGYKISNPTIYGTMSDDELQNLFTGYGYDVRFVEAGSASSPATPAVHEKMMNTLEWAYGKIREIQRKARTVEETQKTKFTARAAGKTLKPHWPLIILRTLKGWTGIHDFHGKKVEGSFRSHGIPLTDPESNPDMFKALKHWLESYRVHELVDEKGAPKKSLLRFVPQGKWRMGMNSHAFGGSLRKELKLPKISEYEVRSEIRGKGNLRNTSAVALYLRDLFVKNDAEKNFRFFCPDETESNKFEALFEATKRAYVWPLKKQDENLAPDGRVMEILSEHTLQGWLQGYLLTGRHGFFSTYEAFGMINASMIDQYAKFLKQSKKISWRKPISSLNYLMTSVGWRQEHNGYSHQNPSLISNILEKHGAFSSVYFPVDNNSFLAILEDCLKRTNAINVVVAGKQIMPQWLTLREAVKQVRVGVGRWDWINRDHAKNPDVVLAAAGDYMTLEAMAAIDILREKVPSLKIRFVNVSELTSLGIGDERHPFRLGSDEFKYYFTNHRPIVFNFHGYPDVIKKLVWNHPASQRFSIHGYEEEGTTTTPFDMQVLNRTSRFHLCMDLIEQGCSRNKELRREKKSLQQFFEEKLDEHREYIKKHGRDLPEIEHWRWGESSE